MDEERSLLFETYKIHTELAERVAHLREGLNKLYAGMVVSIVSGSVLLYRFAPSTEAVWALPGLGILVSLSWMISLHSVTGRLSAKHKVLVALEANLPFDFLKREDEEFNTERFIRRKISGLMMPAAFLVACVVWLIFLLNPCE